MRPALHALPLLAALTLALAGCASPSAGPSAAAPSRITLPSGVIVETLQTGLGDPPGPRDVVRVHYRGTFEDGREFDSSYARDRPAEFPLDRVIRCWTEGLQHMRGGGKARLYCPSATAYGEKGAPPFVMPNTPLKFEIELLLVLRR